MRSVAEVSSVISGNLKALKEPGYFVPILFIAFSICILYIISIINYLLFHSIVECGGLVVVFSIFIIVWNTRKIYTDGFLFIIGISFLFFGFIDLIHTLAYKSMGIFPGNSSDLPTQLWIAARYFQGIMFLVATFFIGKKITSNRKYDWEVVFSFCFTVSALLLSSIFIWDIFPHCYIEGSGLTGFKIISEYLISLIFIATIIILYQKRELFDPGVWKLLIIAQVFLILGELTFTSYIGVFGFMNMIGHMFRLISIYLFYRVFVVVGITQPYDLILRNLKQKERDLEETLEQFRTVFNNTNHLMGILDPQGNLIKMNNVAAQYLRDEEIEPETILGKPFWSTPWWIHDSKQQELLKRAIKSAVSGEIIQFETSHPYGSGLINIDFSLKPVKNKDGGVFLLIAEGWDITTRKQAEEAVQVTIKINQMIDSMTTRDCITYTLEEAERLTNSAIAFFHLIKHDEEEIQLVAWSKNTLTGCNVPKESTRHYPVSKAGIWADCIRERKTIIHNDYANVPGRKGLPDGHVPITRELIVPVFEDNRIVAIIGVGNKPVLYSDLDSNVLTLLAKNTWTFIQRKHVEEELKESESRFRALFNSMSSGVAIYKAINNGDDFIFVDFNPGAELIENLSKNEVIGKRVSEVFPGVLEFGIMDVFRRVWNTGIPENHPLSQYRDNRISSWRENYVSRLPSGEIVAIYDDVTERKLVEEAIKRSESEWKSTFNAINDSVFLINDKGEIIRHNHAFEIFTGKSSVEIEGKSCSEIMHQISSIYHGCPNVRARHSLQRESQELLIQGRWFVAVVDPVISEDGEILGEVHLIIDITERKKAEEALKLANKKMNLLSSITRHDINNQLTSLKGYLELLKETHFDEIQSLIYIEKLEQVTESIEHQIRFTKEYEDMGVKTPNWQKVDDCIFEAQASLPVREIRILSYCADLELFADPLLKKVFYNLIENALRYGGPEMTMIRFSWKNSKEGLILTAEDDGFGVPDLDKERVFEQGFGQHTGLGLFLSKEILSITGITIAETGRYGEGARFEIVVPEDMYRF